MGDRVGGPRGPSPQRPSPQRPSEAPRGAAAPTPTGLLDLPEHVVAQLPVNARTLVNIAGTHPELRAVQRPEATQRAALRRTLFDPGEPLALRAKALATLAAAGEVDLAEGSAELLCAPGGATGAHAAAQGARETLAALVGPDSGPAEVERGVRLLLRVALGGETEEVRSWAVQTTAAAQALSTPAALRCVALDHAAGAMGHVAQTAVALLQSALDVPALAAAARCALHDVLLGASAGLVGESLIIGVLASQGTDEIRMLSARARGWYGQPTDVANRQAALAGLTELADGADLPDLLAIFAALHRAVRPQGVLHAAPKPGDVAVARAAQDVLDRHPSPFARLVAPAGSFQWPGVSGEPAALRRHNEVNRLLGSLHHIYRLDKPQWEETVRALAALPVAEVVPALVAVARDSYHAAADMALQALAALLAAHPGDPDVLAGLAAVVRRGTTLAGSGRIMAQAAAELVDHGGLAAVPHLAAIARESDRRKGDGSPRLDEMAAVALGRLDAAHPGTPDVEEALLGAAVRGGAGIRARRAAAEALLLSPRGPRHVRQFFELALSGGEWWPASVLLDALRRHPEDEGLVAALGRLAREGAPEVRERVNAVLAARGERRFLGAMVAAARGEIAEAAPVARRRIVDLLAEAPADPELATALWEATPWPPRGAPRGALPGQPGPRVVAALGAVARASTDPATREGASRALLALLREGPVLPGLAAALRAAARANRDAGIHGELTEALRAVEPGA